MAKTKRNKRIGKLVPGNPKKTDIMQPVPKKPEPSIAESSGSLSSKSQVVMEEMVYQHFHMGPLPDPLTLERYEKICPGVARQMVDAMSKEQARRIENQKEFWLDTKRRRRMSFALGTLICILAGWAINKDYPITASIIIALVGILTYVNKDHIRQDMNPTKPTRPDRETGKT